MTEEEKSMKSQNVVKSQRYVNWNTSNNENRTLHWYTWADGRFRHHIYIN